MASLSGRMTFPPPTFTLEGPRGVELGVELGAELEEGGEVRFFHYINITKTLLVLVYQP